MLPDEVLYDIFELALPECDWLSLVSVCRQWNYVMQSFFAVPCRSCGQGVAGDSTKPCCVCFNQVCYRCGTVKVGSWNFRQYSCKIHRSNQKYSQNIHSAEPGVSE